MTRQGALFTTRLGAAAFAFGCANSAQSPPPAQAPATATAPTSLVAVHREGDPVSYGPPLVSPSSSERPTLAEKAPEKTPPPKPEPPAYTPGDPAPCTTGGNVLVFSGEAGDPVHSGTKVLRGGHHTVYGSTSHRQVRLTLDPDDRAEGHGYGVDLTSHGLDLPLKVGAYDDAWRTPGRDRKHPGLAISANAGTCNKSFGKFRIFELAWSGTKVAKLTVTFSRTCEFRDETLHGCVHYENPLLAPETSSGVENLKRRAEVLAHCAPGKNLLYLEGEPKALLHVGTTQFENATMRVRTNQNRDFAAFDIARPGVSDFKATFKTPSKAEPLARGKYFDTGWGSEESSTLSLSTGSIACGDTIAAFEVADISWAGSVLERVTVAFEQQCSGKSPILRGCVSYQAP